MLLKFGGDNVGRLSSSTNDLLKLKDVFSGAGVSYQVIIPCGGFFCLTLILFKNFQALLSHKMSVS